MRSNIVFVLLVAMLGGLVAGLVLKERRSHTAPEPVAVPTPETSAAPSANPAPSSTPSASAAARGDAGKAPDAGPTRLRVVALGWDLVTPGLLVNDGREPNPASEFSKKKLDVHLAAVDEMLAVEQSLARGGEDADGADIAIVPLPRFVASYGRLRALGPQIFFVAGHSRGRETLLSKVGPLSKIDRKGDVLVEGKAGTSAALLALFALEAEGVSADRVKFVEGEEAKEASLEARDSRAADDAAQVREHVAVGTASATRLVPVVAIAQRAFIENNTAALASWASVWLDALARVEADPTVAARKVAEEKGAPEPLALLTRLGQLAPTTLRENARTMGLAGRSAATTAELFARTWRLFQEARVLTSPPPEAAPLNGTVIAQLVRAAPQKIAEDEAAPPKAPTPDEESKALIVRRVVDKKLDEQKVVAEAGFMADVFPRSRILVTVHKQGVTDKAGTATIVERIHERYGLTEQRVRAGKVRGTLGAVATIEVLPVK